MVMASENSMKSWQRGCSSGSWQATSDGHVSSHVSLPMR